jgi:isoquinoline 1-oxidoreductase beta subunit
MSANPTLKRRDFLKLTGLAGAGLVLGFRLPETREEAPAPDFMIMNMAQPTAEFTPNAFLRIAPDGMVTVVVPRSELGQGVNTTLPMVLAEELEADWEMIRTEQAPPDRAYGDQLTGGSTSIQQNYSPMRRAGAAARMMLIAAAAQTWGVAPESCTAEHGAVLHADSGQKLTYGELVETATTLEAPKSNSIQTKDAKDFRIIGTRLASKDFPAIVTGRATYGSDVQLPGMLVATVARCPVFGGRVASFDASAAEAVEGVRKVVQIDAGVAVVADNTWAVLKGREALDITWDEGNNAGLNSADIAQQLKDKAVQTDLAQDENVKTYIEALYDQPYLAHAPMEPMVCVADVRADGSDVWAPTQDRASAQSAASGAGATRPLTLHVPQVIGGGFGRRIRVDYVGEAVTLSKEVGAPVKVIWTREDDIQHDFYRPVTTHWLRGGVDADGMPVAWEHHIAAASSLSGVTDGSRLPYDIDQKTQAHSLTIPVPTGYWRAVYNTNNAFVVESFFDELAAAGGKDPYELRMALLPDGARKTALELAATKAGWGSALPEGWGRGVALFSTWGVTHVAQVAEVSVASDGTVRVHRVVCAVDCGRPVNPSVVEAQMEGGIVFALSAVLHGEITIENGRVKQGNFNDYPMLRIDEMPVVEVYIVDSESDPKGIGEMAGPPISAAVGNAIFAATGKRVRRLPVRPEDLT